MLPTLSTVDDLGDVDDTTMDTYRLPMCPKTCTTPAAFKHEADKVYPGAVELVGGRLAVAQVNLGVLHRDDDIGDCISWVLRADNGKKEHIAHFFGMDALYIAFGFEVVVRYQSDAGVIGNYHELVPNYVDAFDFELHTTDGATNALASMFGRTKWLDGKMYGVTGRRENWTSSDANGPLLNKDFLDRFVAGAMDTLLGRFSENKAWLVVDYYALDTLAHGTESEAEGASFTDRCVFSGGGR